MSKPCRFIKYSEILNENINSNILDMIYNGKETKSYTLVDNKDFELKFNNMDSYFILLWINVKSGSKYTGLDIFKAIVSYCKKEKLSEIVATASRGKFKGLDTNGFYTLIKWGFESTKGIDWINTILDTNYKSWEEARDDGEFLPNWKKHGKESDVEFDLSKNSLSLRIFNKLLKK